MASDESPEDAARRALREEVSDLFEDDETPVLLDKKMVRGSTHNKDRLTATTLTTKEDMADDLADLQQVMEADMTSSRQAAQEVDE